MSEENSIQSDADRAEAQCDHLMKAQEQSAADKLEAIVEALRYCFPFFQDDAEITPEIIARAGSEYVNEVMAPGPREFTFWDQDGNVRKVVHEAFEETEGFIIPDDADWEVTSISRAPSSGDSTASPHDQRLIETIRTAVNAEREACAEIADSMGGPFIECDAVGDGYREAKQHIATAIRARGQKS